MRTFVSLIKCETNLCNTVINIRGLYFKLQEVNCRRHPTCFSYTDHIFFIGLIPFFSFPSFFCQIQRNLQLRIEEQGRCLQMMFEKQCKPGTETFKAPSFTTIETPFGMSSNATKDSLSKNEMEASLVLDHCRSGPDQVNGSTRVEEGSLEKCGKPDSPKTQHAIASEDSAQAPKRQRTE